MRPFPVPGTDEGFMFIVAGVALSASRDDALEVLAPLDAEGPEIHHLVVLPNERAGGQQEAILRASGRLRRVRTGEGPPGYVVTLVDEDRLGIRAAQSASVLHHAFCHRNVRVWVVANPGAIIE